MPRRNQRVPTRRARRRTALAREAAILSLKSKTARRTRKAERREEQRLAWTIPPRWFDRRDA